MLINFNLERLRELLYDFYRITGLTVSVWDANMNMLLYEPKEMSSFCRKIREYPEGRLRCYGSDVAVCADCAATGKPSTRICHAGLVDNAVPIKYKDEILGYIMFGQAISGDKTLAYPKIEKLSRELGIDHDLLLELYGELASYDDGRIQAAVNLLKMSARYLWLSEYIEITADPMASLIEYYVQSHIAGDLSLETICRETGISKNKLYKLSHESFGMPIGDYVTSVRIKEAKHLLASTSLPVGEICERVGIQDYNYFSKFFKKHVGTSPSKYRRSYPIEI